MALSDERIDAEAFARWGDMKGAPLAMCRGFARAIEAEVCKADTELIRQMLEALEFEWGGEPLGSLTWASITAARARLGDTK